MQYGLQRDLHTKDGGGTKQDSCTHDSPFLPHGLEDSSLWLVGAPDQWINGLSMGSLVIVSRDGPWLK